MNQKGHWVLLAALWALTTAAGIMLIWGWEIFPGPAAEEAFIIDGTMKLLTVLSVPVFTLVVILLVYSMLRFRRQGALVEDGPPIRENLGLQIVWVVITLVLVLFLAGYGSVGLMEVRGVHAEHRGGNELVVQVTGNQWFWEYTYPTLGISTKEELRLPIGRPVRFEITANDVIHSFWIPAFRTKIDAVPGLMTTIYATPTKSGSFHEDYNFRVQCAELCGLGHGTMTTQVVVVEPADFDTWASQQARSR